RRLLAALVLSAQQARGQREEGEEPQTEMFAGGQHLVLHLALKQREEVLRRDEAGSARGCPVRIRDLPAREVGIADVANLALAHEVVQGAQRLIEGRVGVVAVELVKVDV